MPRFTEKVVIVTGATSGIGEAAALLFAGEGARVIIAARREDKGSALVGRIRAAGGEATFVRTDVRSMDSVANMVRTAIEHYGGIDCAFNNAGVIGRTGSLTPDQPEEEWDAVMDVNLKGIWRCMKHEIPEMLKRGRGAIVNNASDVGLVGSGVGISPYVASKHGVVGLTRSASLEYADKGVRVNAICPGFTRSEMSAPVLALDEKTVSRIVKQHTPMGRIASADEIALAALWLCSDEASFVTGAALSIDGGSTAR